MKTSSVVTYVSEHNASFGHVEGCGHCAGDCARCKPTEGVLAVGKILGVGMMKARRSEGGPPCPPVFVLTSVAISKVTLQVE